MNPIRTIRRFACIVAGLTAALLALSAGAPAAFAYVLPPPGGSGGTLGPPPRAIVTGGTPGWQITPIATGTALLTAALAVLLDRARAARRHMTAPTG